LVTVPVIVTVLILNFLFQQVDGILSPLIKRALGYSIPGMGLLATLALILLVGILVRNMVGSRLFGLGELLFVRTPLVRAVYSAAKQLVEAVALPERNSFKRAVLFEYPRKGTYILGFASARTHLKEGPVTGDLVAVFVPSTPTPVTGFVILVPANEVYELAMATEDIVKMIVSGGITTPPELFRAPQIQTLTETSPP
jgi:uncharacterized membrane protein